MSTRCNVVIKDDYQTIYIYRHSDGYPKCTGEDLKEFVKDYTTGALRNNAAQSAGWLIVRGHFEYKGAQPAGTYDNGKVLWPAEPNKTGPAPDKNDRMYGWKVGAYEPTTEIHGDVDYVYTIDLVKMELSCSDKKAFKTVKFGSKGDK